MPKEQELKKGREIVVGIDDHPIDGTNGRVYGFQTEFRDNVPAMSKELEEALRNSPEAQQSNSIREFFNRLIERGRGNRSNGNHNGSNGRHHT
jgi:hypothetical protein